MINQKAMNWKTPTLNPWMSEIPIRSTVESVVTTNNCPLTTNYGQLTLSQFLVLFGLVWCCLVLFGPKIYFYSFERFPEIREGPNGQNKFLGGLGQNSRADEIRIKIKGQRW